MAEVAAISATPGRSGGHFRDPVPQVAGRSGGHFRDLVPQVAGRNIDQVSESGRVHV